MGIYGNLSYSSKENLMINITSDEKSYEKVEDLFKEYTVLGGNHGVEKLVDKTFELPIVRR